MGGGGAGEAGWVDEAVEENHLEDGREDIVEADGTLEEGGEVAAGVDGGGEARHGGGRQAGGGGHLGVTLGPTEGKCTAGQPALKSFEHG